MLRFHHEITEEIESLLYIKELILLLSLLEKLCVDSREHYLAGSMVA